MDNAHPDPHDAEATDEAAPPAGGDGGDGGGDGTTNVGGQNVAPPTAEKKWYIVNTYSGH